MSAALEQLQRTLHNVGQVALARMRPGDSLQMAHERSKLIEWLDDSLSELEESSGDRIADTLRAFEQNRYVSGLRQARLLCYGSTQPFGTPPQRLIEHGELFAILLDYIGRNHYRTRAFRKCYRGLLNCYFSYDPEAPDNLAEGRHNREMLRRFLDKHKDDLATSGHDPDWVIALPTHHHLFERDPCKAYRLEDLAQNLAALAELRERLEIGDDSWLMRKIVLSQVRDAIALDDASFGAYVDSLLLLLLDHPLHADTALALMLDRHARSYRMEIGAALRDYAIRLWGNPWLAANAYQWRCSPEARGMVANALRRHLIGQFFSSLSGGNGENQRRLNFWELYCGDMQGMYFALGNDAFVRSHLDLYKFRQNAKGLVVRLTEGRSDTHALIMQFGDHHVVEFNSHHNPAYFYDTRHGIPPFYLSKGWVEIGALSASKITHGVETAPKSKAVRHQDSSLLEWEGRFAELMGSTPNAIEAFCRKYQCRHEDLRGEGGREWIRPTEQTQCGAEGWAVPRGWGFRPAPDGQGYYRA